MTGPEHYAEAQALLIAADDGGFDREALTARAQVHATLALAAATALASHDEYDSPDHVAWHAAASLADPEDPEVTP